MMKLIHETENEKLLYYCSQYRTPIPQTDQSSEDKVSLYRVIQDSAEIGIITCGRISSSEGFNLLSLCIKREFRTKTVIENTLHLFFETVFSDKQIEEVYWRIRIPADSRNIYTALLKNVSGIRYKDIPLTKKFRILSKKILCKETFNPIQVGEQMTFSNGFMLKPIRDLSQTELSSLRDIPVSENVAFTAQGCNADHSVIIQNNTTDKIIGWILTCVHDNDMIEIRRAYVFPEFRKMSTWVNCFGLQIRRLAEKFSVISFQVEQDNVKMYRVMKKYFQDSVMDITEVHLIKITRL